MSKKAKDNIKENQRKRYQQLIHYRKEALQNKRVLFLLSIIMSVKTLKFGNIEDNKKEFHQSKQPINPIVVSNNFKHIDDGSKHFIGYKEGEIVKPLCIILSQMT